jgi:polysaccharide chain length determinant protein (PEP-CTERM system associated)
MKDLTKIDPSEYLKIIFRRRWYVVATFLIVSTSVGIYAWHKPNVYRSASRVQVETAIVPQDYVRSSVRSTPEDQIASIRGAVQSRSFLERMIQDFQLFSYGIDQGFSMEDAVKSVSNSIEITTASKDTFSLAFLSTSPQLAQSLTKRMVETLIQSSASTRKNKAIETDQFLETQLSDTSQKLAAQEEKIKQFKMEHLGGTPDQLNTTMNSLSRLDVQLASVENVLQQLRDKQNSLETMDRTRKQMMLQSKDLFPSDDNFPVEESNDSGKSTLIAAKESELAALAAKYTPQHPDIVRLTGEIEFLKKKMTKEKESAAKSSELNSHGDNGVSQPRGSDPAMDAMLNAANPEIESLKNDIKRQERERESIQSKIRTIQSRLNLAPVLEQELSALTREYGTLKMQYESLQGKKFQSQMTANMESNKNSDTYKVIDEASLPEKPVSPNRMQIIGIGLIAGLALGVGSAFGRELLDNAFSSEDEVTTLLKIPVLATISEVTKKQLKKQNKIDPIRKSA